MSVPGRAEAAALLLSVHPSPRLVRHSRAVAEVAAFLAARIAARGVAIDRRLVEVSALLHDIDKALPKTDPLRHVPHGEGSAGWLRQRGFPELAPVVANHPVSCLAESVSLRRPSWSGFDSIEAAVVSYADKRARQRVLPMSERFAIWRRKYPAAPAGSDDPWSADRQASIADRAARLEADVCQAAGVAPADVRRLRWAGRALSRVGTEGSR
jgi:putative nucleotidyltransferase with HDIG domain